MIPKVPLNYFGRGTDFQIPDDSTVVSQIMKEIEEWETLHPDDPNGEQALADYAKSSALQKREEELEDPKKEDKVYEPTSNNVSKKLPGSIKEIRLQISEELLTRLKAHAKYKRKRPRDIIERWIENYTRS